MDQKYNENHCIDDDGGGILYGSVLTTFWLDFLDSLTSPYATKNGPNVSKLAQKWGFCQFSQV